MVNNKHNKSDTESPLQPGKIIKPGSPTDLSSKETEIHKSAQSISVNNSNDNAHMLHTNVKKSSTLVILICVILVIVIIGGLFIGRNYLTKSQGSKNQSSSDSAATQINAKTKDDFVNVCNGYAISNATPFANTPRVITLFEESEINSSNFYPADSYINDKNWVVKDNEYSKINMVGCLKHQSEKDTGKTCEIVESSGKKITLKLFTVEYQLILREAQTGKTIGSYAIDESETTCPTNAYYSENSEKFYTSPDKSKLSQFIGPFIN